MNDRHLTGGQESLFVVMRQQIASTPIRDSRPVTLRHRLASHPRLSAGGAAALLAVCATLASILLTGVLATAPPAFAVTVTGNRVTITLREFDALKALNARLAAEGIPIRAVPVLAGCTATARLVSAKGSIKRTIEAGRASGPATLTIELSHRPPPGETLIVGESSAGHSLLFPHAIEGPVPRCIGVRRFAPRA